MYIHDFLILWSHKSAAVALRHRHAIVSKTTKYQKQIAPSQKQIPSYRNAFHKQKPRVVPRGTNAPGITT